MSMLPPVYITPVHVNSVHIIQSIPPLSPPVYVTQSMSPSPCHPSPCLPSALPVTHFSPSNIYSSLHPHVAPSQSPVSESMRKAAGAEKQFTLET